MVKLLSAGALIFVFSAPVMAVEYEDHSSMLMDHGDGHLMDMAGGMVMGRIPAPCRVVAKKSPRPRKLRACSHNMLRSSLVECMRLIHKNLILNHALN